MMIIANPRSFVVAVVGFKYAIIVDTPLAYYCEEPRTYTTATTHNNDGNCINY